MRAARHVRLVLLVALLSCGLGGCAVAIGAAGGVAAWKALANYDVREYRTTVRAAHDAAIAALAELGYPPPPRPVLGPAEAEVDAGDADIGIAAFPDGQVRVTIGVGTFETTDHRRRAALLHDAIARRVGPAIVPAGGPAGVPAGG